MGCEERFTCKQDAVALEGLKDSSGLSFSLQDKLAEASPLNAEAEWQGGTLAGSNVTGTRTGVHVELSHVGGEISRVEATRGEDEQGSFPFVWTCTDHMLADVHIRVTTDDGVLDEELDGTLEAYDVENVWNVAGATEVQSLRGTLQPSGAETLSVVLSFGDPDRVLGMTINAWGKDAYKPKPKAGEDELSALAVETLMQVTF